QKAGCRETTTQPASETSADADRQITLNGPDGAAAAADHIHADCLIGVELGQAQEPLSAYLEHGFVLDLVVPTLRLFGTDDFVHPFLALLCASQGAHHTERQRQPIGHPLVE